MVKFSRCSVILLTGLLAATLSNATYAKGDVKESCRCEGTHESKFTRGAITLYYDEKLSDPYFDFPDISNSAECIKKNGMEAEGWVVTPAPPNSSEAVILEWQLNPIPNQSTGKLINCRSIAKASSNHRR